MYNNCINNYLEQIRGIALEAVKILDITWIYLMLLLKFSLINFNNIIHIVTCKNK